MNTVYGNTSASFEKGIPESSDNVKPLLAEKPKRKRASRRMPELWAVVEMPDGSRQAYTFVTKAIQVAGEAGVRTVQLCRIVPKTRGFKVVETVSV